MKKTIAFVSNNAWSVYNYRLPVLRHLMQQGHQVLVFAPDDAFSAKLQSEGCRFIPLVFTNKSENPFQDIRLFRQLRSLYRHWKPDFIFHFVVKPNIYGSLAAATLGIPSVAVVTGLGYAFARKNWLYWIVRYLYQYALRKVKEVWFLNNEDARVFIDQHIVAIQKVRVLPGEGVDTTYFKRQSPAHDRSGEPFLFLMSARLLKSKGIGLYADAIRLLQKKKVNARFQLMGFFENEHPDAISEAELNKWQEEGLLDYKGYQQDVRPCLEQADCFVFPSYYHEGMPRCLMEAASMELPIITSNNKGCKELVRHQYNGLLCHLHDPFDLAEQMMQMMRLSFAERQAMGRRGREWMVEKFDIRQVIQEYDALLRLAFLA